VEGGRRRVARHVHRAQLELVLRGDRDARAVAGDLHARGGQHPLGVVAARLGLDDRGRA
jgi:hypothetical protein